MRSVWSRFLPLFARIVLVAGLIVYFVWSEVDRVAPPPVPVAQPAFVEFAWNSGRGNLLGVQPDLHPAHFASENNYERSLDAYFAAAAARGWLGEKTVVVFPEHIGTWLVAAGEKPGVYSAATVQSAMSQLVSARLFSFLLTLPFAPARDRARHAIFSLKAADMAAIYSRVYARLAAKYRVTIVAGSIVLPAPRVENNRVVVGGGALQNTSFVFYADGRLDERVVRKVYPTAEELDFIQPGGLADLPVFDTPAGKVGAIICADSWYPAVYERMAAQGATLLVTSSLLTPAGVWNQPWHGYNGAPAPADVNPADVRSITEGQAWLKYALAARARTARVSHGLTVFMRGRLWDMETDGRGLAVQYGGVREESPGTGSALVNVWL